MPVSPTTLRRLSSVLLAITLIVPSWAHAQGTHAASPTMGAAEVAKRLSRPGIEGALKRLDGRRVSHPRLFGGRADVNGIVAAARAERRPGMAALADTLKRHPVRAIPAVLKAQIQSSEAAPRMTSWWQQDRLLEGMAEAAFVWYVGKDPWFVDEVKARMRLFGPAVLARRCTGEVTETRDYVWYFALAYDLAYDGLDEAERILVRDIVSTCMRSSLAGTVDTLRRHPDNGAAFNALGKLVGALLILDGDTPMARPALERALPAYVGALSPWGGEDGGFANGSTYALWDTGESLLVWDLVERVLKVPLYRKPWLERLIRYVAYALPPGTPAGAFGDGAEVARREEWARLGKALALRSSMPLARWYAAQLKGADPARLQLLLSPREIKASARLPAGTPASAAFRSIGLAAMHSELDDPRRVSVLFKSSPFGSLNHSHADQNSFVLYANGQVLAMDSGHYDAYGSAHWRQWYKQTRAHNAITYDQGQGQPLGPLGLGERRFAGRLVRFEQTAQHDLAIGDASRAYGDGVTLARRSILLIRPATVVIVDQLASRSARRWEWNLHTPVPLQGPADGFDMTVAQVRLCGTVRALDALEIATRPGYTPPPTGQIQELPHYWNRISARQARSRATFVAVLRVDCQGPEPVIDIGTSGAGRVRASGWTLRFDADGDVTVPASE